MSELDPPQTHPATGSHDTADLQALLGADQVRPWFRRPLVIVGIAGALAVALILYLVLGGSSQTAYATTPAARSDLTVTVSATGNLQPTNQVEVGSEQSGLVEAVFVDNNDRVTKGQPLARLDTSRLTDTLNQARAALGAAEAALVQARATDAQANAILRRQEEVWRLSGGKVPAETELDSARADVRRAQAGIRAAEAQVAQAKAQVSSAQTGLDKATIYSPVNGVVLSRSVDPGQTVAASLQAPTLFTLAEDLGQMDLEVKVDEADVGQVKAGQSATFTVDAYPGRTFTATIKRVDLGANTGSDSSSSSSVVAYIALLSVQNPGLLLRPGMTATAEIVTTKRTNVLIVPNAALRFRPATTSQNGSITSVLMPRGPGSDSERTATAGEGSSQTVYILDAEGRSAARKVTIGSSDGSVTEITSGELKEGDKVITGQLSGTSTSAQALVKVPRGGATTLDRRRG